MKCNRLLCCTAAWLVWSVISGIGFFLFFWLLIAERDPYGLIAVIFPVFSSLMLALFLYEYPNVSLDEQGVRVKWWLRTRFYPWSDICQAEFPAFAQGDIASTAWFWSELAVPNEATGIFCFI